MAINPILQTGISGIQMGLKGLREAAQDVAELNLDDRRDAGVARDDSIAPPNRPTDQLEDAAVAIIDMKMHARQVQASAKVVETADEMLGFLIDVHA